MTRHHLIAIVVMMVAALATITYMLWQSRD
jgi:hypothetical protein